jgi:hypothetical protein
MGDGQGETISISSELSLPEVLPYTSLKQKQLTISLYLLTLSNDR